MRIVRNLVGAACVYHIVWGSIMGKLVLLSKGIIVWGS